MLKKKWEYNEAEHQLFVDFKKAYDLVWKRGLVQYSHWVWYPYETGKANKIVSGCNL